MAFPYSTEGKVVIATDVPANAERVADGVEKWLRSQGAQDLRRVPGRIQFRGNPVYTTAFRRRMKDPKASLWKAPGLRGIRESAIEFEKHADKVIIHFRVSSGFFDLTTVLPLLLVAAVLAKLSLLLPVPLFAAGVVLHIRLTPRFLRQYFENELPIAAIRGLANGAAAELAALRSRSQLMGASNPA